MNEFKEFGALSEAAKTAFKKVSITAVKSAKALKQATATTRDFARELMRIRETEETMKARNDVIDTRNYAIGGLVEFKRIEPFSNIAAKFADEPSKPINLIPKMDSAEFTLGTITISKEQMEKMKFPSLKYEFKWNIEEWILLNVIGIPNKRVKHLYFHSKKARVRKKQISRIKEYIREGEKTCTQQSS